MKKRLYLNQLCQINTRDSASCHFNVAARLASKPERLLHQYCFFSFMVVVTLAAVVDN